MKQDHPFNHLRSRSLLVWLVVSLVFVTPLFLLTTLIPDPLFELIIGQVWFCGLILVWFFHQVKKHKLKPQQIIGKLPPKWESLRLIVMVVPALMFSIGTTQLVYLLVSFLAPEFLEELLEEDLFLTAAETSFPFLYNLLLSISLVILAPVLEELLFRGILLQRWRVKWGVTPALIISALIFGILHFNVIALFNVGLLMAVLYWRSNCLLIPIICHGINNGLVVAVTLSVMFFGETQPYTIEQIRSDWKVGIIWIVLSLPWLIYFFVKNWPPQETLLPYVANGLKEKKL